MVKLEFLYVYSFCRKKIKFENVIIKKLQLRLFDIFIEIFFTVIDFCSASHFWIAWRILDVVFTRLYFPPQIKCISFAARKIRKFTNFNI